jgi:hypothetical protein
MDPKLAEQLKNAVKSPLEKAAGRFFGDGAKAAITQHVTAQNIQRITTVAGKKVVPILKEKLGKKPGGAAGGN